jgi:hypothetical protein
MAERRKAFLGLRSNVHFFASHHGFARLDTRVKALSLLYDEVMLEAGVYEGSVGEGFSDGWVMPFTSEDQLRPMRTRRGADFRLTVSLEGSTQPSSTMSTTLVKSFRAQFISLAREAASAKADWMQFVNFDALSEGVKEADRLRSSWEWEDRALIDEMLPDIPRFLKSALVRHLYTDLARAYLFGFEAAPDGEHAHLLQMKASDASEIALGGGRVLRLAVPDIRLATWEDIAELRRDRGLSNLREKLREIEVAGLTDQEVIARLEREHAEELARRMPRWRDRAVDVAWNLVSFIPIVGQASGAIQIAARTPSTVRAQRHWTASLMRIRQRTEARSRASLNGS